MASFADYYYTLHYYYRVHLANVLTQQLSVEIPVVKDELVRAGLWNQAWTPSKIVGMILQAYPSIDDLYAFSVNESARAEVALDALEVLNRASHLERIQTLLTDDLQPLITQSWWPAGIGAAEIVAFINSVPLDLEGLQIIANFPDCRATAVCETLLERGVTVS